VLALAGLKRLLVVQALARAAQCLLQNEDAIWTALHSVLQCNMTRQSLLRHHRRNGRELDKLKATIDTVKIMPFVHDDDE
jgi:hypothetical protein